MRKMFWKIKEERGTTLVITLMIMVILVLIGMAALMTSSLDLRISGNERVQKQAFNVAEAGLDYARVNPPEAWNTIYTKGTTGSKKDYRKESQNPQDFEITVTSDGIANVAAKLPPTGSGTGVTTARAYLFRLDSTGYGPNSAQSQLQMRGWVIAAEDPI